MAGKVPSQRYLKVAVILFFISLFLLFYVTKLEPEVVLNKCEAVGETTCNNLDFDCITTEERNKSGLNGHDRDVLDELETRNATLIFQKYKAESYLEPEKLKLQNERDPVAIVLVTSLAKDVKKRCNIRKSYQQWAEQESIKVFFFIGIWEKNERFNAELEALTKENKKYGDLVVISYKEGYYRLTIKVLRMMEWFLKHYQKTFFIKADQDVFINIPKLRSHLESKNVSKDGYYIGGYYYVNNVISADPKSKFFLAHLNFWMNGAINLPDFALGPIYVLSWKTVDAMFKGSFHEPLFPFEDAYFNGYLRTKLNLAEIDKLNISHAECSNITKCKILMDLKKLQSSCALLGLDSTRMFLKLYDGVNKRLK